MVRPAPEVDQPTYEIVDEVGRYDHRNHANARVLLVPGTTAYEEYYFRHPERKEWDDETRRIAAEALVRKREKDPVNMQFHPATFYGRFALSDNGIVEGTTRPPGAPKNVPERVDVDPVKWPGR